IYQQGRNQAFTYDDLGRLVTASGWGAWGRRYEYDRWGNRTAVWDATSGGSKIQDAAMQQQAGRPAGVPSNRIASVNGTTYTYDAAGNLTSEGAGGHNYQYDGEGRLVSVDNGAAKYYYDSANRRVK